jgi:hypothetical protein
MDKNRWLINIEHDPDTDESLLTLPPDLLEATGWQVGDELLSIDLQDGTWELKKK